MSKKTLAFKCMNCGGIWEDRAKALSHKCIQRHDPSFLLEVEVSHDKITR